MRDTEKKAQPNPRTLQPSKRHPGVADTSKANHALSSYRNGPVKAGVDVSDKNIKLIPDTITPIRKASYPTAIVPTATKIVKPRSDAAKHCRPSSPGIRGKIAQPPYASTIKSMPYY